MAPLVLVVVGREYADGVELSLVVLGGGGVAHGRGGRSARCVVVVVSGKGSLEVQRVHVQLGSPRAFSRALRAIGSRSQGPIPDLEFGYLNRTNGVTGENQNTGSVARRERSPGEGTPCPPQPQSQLCRTSRSLSRPSCTARLDTLFHRRTYCCASPQTLCLGHGLCTALAELSSRRPRLLILMTLSSRSQIHPADPFSASAPSRSTHMARPIAFLCFNPFLPYRSMSMPNVLIPVSATSYESHSVYIPVRRPCPSRCP